MAATSSATHLTSRIVHRLLGRRGWKAVRAAYRAFRPKLVPGGPRVDYPDDVADRVTLRRELDDVEIHDYDDAEQRAYLDHAFERLRVTMAFLPDLPAGARVLELGAHPYFLTQLLRGRGLDVTPTNFFGGDGAPSTAVQKVSRRSTGEVTEFEFDHFNVERHPFPYSDDTFDLVLFCELLEHLPYDPTHALSESHRVLKDGGWLVLTTPNAARLDNLARMIEGRNVYEPLSGYGVYGRHNREYTVDELRDLLTALGYAVDDVFAADVTPRPVDPDDLPTGFAVEHRGDNLFARARATGDSRREYPDWLYQSIHAYRARADAEGT